MIVLLPMEAVVASLKPKPKHALIPPYYDDQQPEQWHNKQQHHHQPTTSEWRATSTIAMEKVIAVMIKNFEATAQQLSNCKFPLQVHYYMTNAVLDGDTGEMLKYWHLLKSPKYREAWTFSAANKGLEIE